MPGATTRVLNPPRTVDPYYHQAQKLAELEGRIALLERPSGFGAAWRFGYASDSSLRQTTSSSFAEITTGLRIAMVPIEGAYVEFNLTFQFEHNVTNGKLQVEIRDVVAGGNIVAAGIFSQSGGPVASQNLHWNYHAVVRTSSLAAVNQVRTFTPIFANPSGGTASVRGDASVTTFTVKQFAA